MFYVDPRGRGDFTQLQTALDWLSAHPSEKPELELAEGRYEGPFYCAVPGLRLRGQGRDETLLTAGLAAQQRHADGRTYGTFRTATLFLDADHIEVHGLSVQNRAGWGPTVGQAIALYADSDDLLVEDCALLGRQDTLFTAPLPERELQVDGFRGPKQFAPRRRNRQIYRRCLIAGDVDFIFGGAQALFEDCELRSLWREGQEGCQGYVTAASTQRDERFGYYFQSCRFSAEKGLEDASVYLGRPWREAARCCLNDCELGAHIHPQLWSDWDKPQAHEQAVYAVYATRAADGSPLRPGSQASWTSLDPLAAEDCTKEAFLDYVRKQAVQDGRYFSH